MKRKTPKERLGIGSSKNDNVLTPDWIYESLHSEFDFNNDPCPPGYEKGISPDGLETEWGERNFVNPPFSQIKKWIMKAIKERNKGKLSVLLLTARINSQYWWNYVWPEASEIRFLQGEVKFKGYDSFLPIPISIVVFHPDKDYSLLWGKISKGYLSGREFIRITSPLSELTGSSQYSPPKDEKSGPTSLERKCF